MIVKVIKRTDTEFKWIVGNTFKVLKETDDNKGFYIVLPFGCCRVEKEEVEII